MMCNTDLDGGLELGVEQPAESAVVATEQLAQRLSSPPLVRCRHGGRRSAADLVVCGVDGGHHHLVTIHGATGGGGAGRSIFGSFVDGVANDARHVPECLSGVRKSLMGKIKINNVICAVDDSSGSECETIHGLNDRGSRTVFKVVGRGFNKL